MAEIRVVNVSEGLKRKAASEAALSGISLSDYVIDALKFYHDTLPKPKPTAKETTK